MQGASWVEVPLPSFPRTLCEEAVLLHCVLGVFVVFVVFGCGLWAYSCSLSCPAGLGGFGWYLALSVFLGCVEIRGVMPPASFFCSGWLWSSVLCFLLL